MSAAPLHVKRLHHHQQKLVAFIVQQHALQHQYDAGDVVKPKPPLLAQRDGRFIRFDSDDTEIELEMGVSVPFLKIPLHAKTDVEHSPDHRLTINPAGLLVGATLLFTSFLLVPWAFPAQGHQKRKHIDLNGGRADTEPAEIPGGVSALFKEIHDLLINLNLDPGACSQKAACVFGSQVSKNLPGLLDVMPRIGLLDTITTNGVFKAVTTDSCEKAFSTCSSISTEMFSYGPWLLKMF